MSHRRGTTLVEVVCAVSVLSVVLALATGIIAQLQRAAGHVKQHAESLSAVNRLADQFRADVAEARAMSPLDPNDAGAICRLELDEHRRAEYVQEPRQVVRLLIVDDKPSRRERYQLGPTRTAMSVDDRGTQGLLLALHVPRFAVGAGISSERALRIEALLSPERKTLP